TADERAAGRPAVDHHDAALIGELQPRVALLRRLDLDRPRAVHVQRPLGNVEVVRAHVGQAAAGVFLVTAPGGEVIVYPLGAEIRVIVALRGRAEPEVPVRALGRLLRRQLALDRRAAHADADRVDLADAPAPHVRGRLEEVLAVLAALLAAGLEDDLVVFHGLDDL